MMYYTFFSLGEAQKMFDRIKAESPGAICVIENVNGEWRLGVSI